jgi:NAD(P)-dependent dehydrogenase (short-subunit alcohol dehydrogenase family)
MIRQNVLITAGASGIGLAIARAFLAAGANVFVCDIDRDALAAAKHAHPGLLTGYCDISKRADIEQMVPHGAATLGGIDVLVNNAGVGGPTAPVEAMDPHAWDFVIQVNLTGAFDVTRLAIPYLKQSGSGSIIMMSSSGGRFGYPNRSPYSATKWALIGLTKTLSMELGPHGIRANAILPGAVDGPRFHQVLAGRASVSGKSIEDERRALMGSQSMKDPIDPADIAALAVFLASDAGKSISGQALPIDGDKHIA